MGRWREQWRRLSFKAMDHGHVGCQQPQGICVRAAILHRGQRPPPCRAIDAFEDLGQLPFYLRVGDAKVTARAPASIAVVARAAQSPSPPIRAAEAVEPFTGARQETGLHSMISRRGAAAGMERGRARVILFDTVVCSDDVSWNFRIIVPREIPAERA